VIAYPATVNDPLRELFAVFSVTVKSIVPFPTPGEPEVMLILETPLAAAQEQPLPVVTETEPANPPEVGVMAPI
jgi:hypothetical protein